MGRSRQRNKFQCIPQARRPNAITVNIDSVDATCPGGGRPGLDGLILLGLRDAYNLLADIRDGISVPRHVVDEESAVLTYLIYTSVLIDVCLNDMGISAVHKNDLMVVMKQRLLVEYAAKAQYYAAHPDYALYEMTIGEAEGVLKKYRHSQKHPEKVAETEAFIEQLRQRFPSVANFVKRSFLDIMRDLATGDEYAWLYGAPSALIHGDPEGMRTIFSDGSDGFRHLTMSLSDDHLNAAMVDAGGNALLFIRVFIERYHNGNLQFETRWDDLNRAFQGLLLKHPLGRDADVLEAIKAELLKPADSSIPAADPTARRIEVDA